MHVTMKSTGFENDIDNAFSWFPGVSPDYPRLLQFVCDTTTDPTSYYLIYESDDGKAIEGIIVIDSNTIIQAKGDEGNLFIKSPDNKDEPDKVYTFTLGGSLAEEWAAELKKFACGLVTVKSDREREREAEAAKQEAARKAARQAAEKKAAA